MKCIYCDNNALTGKVVCKQHIQNKGNNNSVKSYTIDVKNREL